jgi:cardiolipin synthase C
VLLWLLGNLLLEVQLPERPEPRGVSPAVAEQLSLHELFEVLPAEGGGNSQVTMLDDNTAAWVERWRLLAGARERLDISYFILKNDIFGVSFLGHLAERGRQGVRVRVLLDAWGTRMSRQPRTDFYLDALLAAENVEVRVYRPMLFRFIDTFLTLNPAAVLASDHGKLLLADELRGLVGGRNLAVEYFADPRIDPTAFYDADVLLEGSETGAALASVFNVLYEGGGAREITDVRLLNGAAEAMALAYEAMDAWLRGVPLPEATEATIRARGLPWLDELHAHPTLYGALRRPSGEALHAPTRIIDSRIRLIAPDDRITRSLALLVRNARESIFIQNPYLIIPKAAADLLAEAAERGVEITILTNSPTSTDLPLAQAFFVHQWPELMARVPTLRLFVGGDRHNLHSKLAVIDGKLGLIGTYNLEPISMAVNSELVAAMWSQAFAERLLELPQQLIAAGPPHTFEYRIARDADGQPLRDADGKVVVAFGPEDHSSEEDLAAARKYRALIRIVRVMPGIEMLF